MVSENQGRKGSANLNHTGSVHPFNSINHSSSYVLKNHRVSRTNYRSNGKMSYLHENINNLKITLFASHELK